MPLKKDGLDRGAHSWHVHPHKKLGRHQTVIRAMWQFVNQLIDRSDVVQVELGVILANPIIRNRFRQGIRCQQESRDLVMTCVAVDAVQFITVTFRVGTDLQILAQAIMEQGFEWKDMVPYAPATRANA